MSFIPADTPLKLADYFKISGVFSLGSIPDYPTGSGAYLQTSVMAADFRGYAEVVFENPEDVVQSWHVDGHNFFVVGLVSYKKPGVISHLFLMVQNSTISNCH